MEIIHKLQRHIHDKNVSDLRKNISELFSTAVGNSSKIYKIKIAKK